MSGTVTSAVMSSPVSAPIHDFDCIYTYDVQRKRQKRWHDGFLRFHAFNQRVMVYDVSRNFIGDTHLKNADSLQDGDEVQLDRGVLVEVGQSRGTTQQDMTALFERRGGQRDERPAPPRPQKGSESATVVPAERSSPVSTDGLLRAKSLNVVLGPRKGIQGRAMVAKQSPFESAKRFKQRSEGPPLQPPPKRQCVDQNPPANSIRHIQPPKATGTLPTPFAPAGDRPGRPLLVDDPRKQSRNMLRADVTISKTLRESRPKELVPRHLQTTEAIGTLPTPLAQALDRPGRPLLVDDARKQSRNAPQADVTVPKTPQQTHAEQSARASSVFTNPQVTSSDKSIQAVHEPERNRPTSKLKVATTRRPKLMCLSRPTTSPMTSQTIDHSPLRPLRPPPNQTASRRAPLRVPTLDDFSSSPPGTNTTVMAFPTSQDLTPSKSRHPARKTTLEMDQELLAASRVVENAQPTLAAIHSQPNAYPNTDKPPAPTQKPMEAPRIPVLPARNPRLSPLRKIHAEPLRGKRNTSVSAYIPPRPPTAPSGPAKAADVNTKPATARASPGSKPSPGPAKPAAVDADPAVGNTHSDAKSLPPDTDTGPWSSTAFDLFGFVVPPGLDPRAEDGRKQLDALKKRCRAIRGSTRGMMREWYD